MKMNVFSIKILVRVLQMVLILSVLLNGIKIDSNKSFGAQYKDCFFVDVAIRKY